ncbi:MAG: hypothetical protein GTN38_04045 [Candidatus Aenigmarchaeota archaeon]|nr:hypothetical protein [Candidatus Aenigmarchaeota archaeon]NIP40832.1 hypothetical protein [Candidatus Aenigmarchaeota archaeon]NIQ17946.1 hypothetical protein [Candidatus Aenigmarchaeota archaeon]
MFNPFSRKKKKPSGEAPMPEPMPSPSRPRGVPTAEVQALSSRGVAEPDIISTLRREGYGISEIDQAMKEALKGRVTPEGPPAPAGPPAPREPPAGPPEPFEPEPLPPAGPPPTEPPRTPIRREESPVPSPLGEFAGVPKGEDFLEREDPSMKGPEFPEEEFPPPPTRRRRTKGIDRREIEELTEVVVDERLRGLDEKFNTIQSQFQRTNSKINALYEEISNLKSSKGGEVKGIGEKIDSYKQDMNELNGRIESMERALKDSLSPMLESLRSLSETVKMLKKKG